MRFHVEIEIYQKSHSWWSDESQYLSTNKSFKRLINRILSAEICIELEIKQQFQNEYL